MKEAMEGYGPYRAMHKTVIQVSIEIRVGVARCRVGVNRIVWERLVRESRGGGTLTGN